MGFLIDLTEKGWVPDSAVRVGIRRLLQRRLDACKSEDAPLDFDNRRPIAIDTDSANAQHYEVTPAFFEKVLGPRRKYSCCWYDGETSTLTEAEEAMLQLTCERAGIMDGMDILELGCGWGSLTLWMAERFPNSAITAVSNANAQRETIEKLAREWSLDNITVKTADINQYRPEQRYDRVVSVEMFEHVRNHVILLERIAGWLKPEGKLFVHVFCHKEHTYTYEDRGDSDWMARHFFSGGMMPSFDYFQKLPVPFSQEYSWAVNGNHYAQTCRDWLARLDEQREDVEALFLKDFAPREAAVHVQRWRMFFMACEELFAWNGGNEWHVGHYLLQPKGGH